MNFIKSNFKVGNTLVPCKGKDNSMSIKEIRINKVMYSKKYQPKYKCAVKYQSGAIDVNVKFLEEQVLNNFTFKLKDLLSKL